MAGGMSRLFVSIEADASPFVRSLEQATKTAQAAGVTLTAAGTSIVSAFEKAFNPTKRLHEELLVLQSAGKSSSEIWTVYKDRILNAAEAETKMGHAVDPLVAELIKQNKAVDSGRMSFENLGKTVQDFVNNPVQALKTSLSGMLEKLGPVAIGIGAVGTAAVAAGVAVFKFVSAAAEQAEQLENLSAQTGISAQQLEALIQIQNEAGLESLDLGRTIGMLNAQLGEGKGDFIDALKNLNIQMVDLATGKPKDAITLLDDLRAALLEIPAGAQRAQAAQDALGGRLRELIPLLLNSKAGIADMTQELISMGVVSSGDTHRALLQFEQTLDDISRAVKTLKTELLGSVMAIAQWTQELMKAHPYLLMITTLVVRMASGAAGMKAFLALMGSGSKAAADLGEAFVGPMQIIPKVDKALEGLKTRLAELKQINLIEVWKSMDKAVNDAATSIEKAGGKAKEFALDLKEALRPAVQDITMWMSNLTIETLKWADESAKSLAEFADKVIHDNSRFESADNAWTAEYIANKKKAQGATTDLGKEVSTVFTNMVQSLAENIIEWKGWADTIERTVKSLAKSLLSAFLEGFLKPLNDQLTSWGRQLGNWLSKIMAGTSGAGGISGIGNLISSSGSAAFSSLLTTATGAGGIALLLKGIMGGGWGSTVGGSALLGASLGSIIPGLGTAIGAAIGAISGTIGKALSNLISGKNAYEAGAPEVLRDFKVEIGQDSVKAIFNALNLSESQAYGIRKDIFSSPVVLQQLYGVAEQQGKVEEFLASLEQVKTAWGDFDFRAAFELGQTTGDWTELNKVFEDAFEHSQRLQEIMPNWREQLLLVSDAAATAAEETAALDTELIAFRDSIAGAITPVETMYETFLNSAELTDEFRQKLKDLGADLSVFEELAALAKSSATELARLATMSGGLNNLRSSIYATTKAGEDFYQVFLNTGEITEAFRQQINSLGGDLASFEAMGNLIRINNQFEELKQHFYDTGEILPELRALFQKFGGDLSVLDAAGNLPTLKSSLTFINSLMSQLQAQLPDPIQQLLSGTMNADVIAALTGAGLDPNSFKGMTDMLGVKSRWEGAGYRPFQELTPELRNFLLTYGGGAGASAVAKYEQGFNTITQGLLNLVGQNIEAKYQDEVKSLLAYLGEVQESTNDEIVNLNTAIEDEFEIVSGNITEALDTAKMAVVGTIDAMIASIDAQTLSITQALDAAKAAVVFELDRLIRIQSGETGVTPEPSGGTETRGSARGEDHGTAIDIVETIDNRGRSRNTREAGFLLQEGSSFSSIVGPTVHIHGDIYGYDDFVQKVRAAKVDLQRQSAWA